MMNRIHLEEGWTTLLLVWAMALVSGIAIHQADLIAGLSILPFVSTAGIAAGVLLSKSRFSGRVAHLFALVYGLAVIAFLIGQTLPADLTWRERILDLLNRQVAWLTKAFAKGTSRDGLIFVMHTSVIFWILAYTSAWYTFREPRVWRVVLPTGLVLLSVIYYYYGPKPLVAYLGVYVILALLYVARTHLSAREKNWRSAAVRYESGALRFNFLRASFLASILALGLAWQLPTLTASAAVSDALTGTGVNRTWRGFQDNWTRLFSSLRSYGSGTSDPYSTSLALGGPRSVGNTIIMDVYVPQQLPNVYWQAIALDTYQDGGWILGDNTQKVLHFPDEGLINTPFTQARTTITQTIVNYLPNSSTLYGAPEIASSNKQMLVTQRDDGAGHVLVHSAQSRFVLRQGETYQVFSRLSMADAQSLRAAATTYPDWINASYLQVPDTITQDTLDLAAQITAAHDNPFDKAIAVRDYLRANIVYNDQIPAPPEGIEPIHYTLFISKEGYCNYYASAMAIMLRSQGIPARIVLGYAQGEYDEESRSYRVRASNAHTWVEVFFPGYGWIQFEPTASLPTETRPESSGNPGDAFASPSLPPLLEREAFLPEEDLNPNDPSLDPEGLLEGDLAETPETAANQRIPFLQIAGALLIGGFAFGAIVMANQFNQRVEANVERSYGRLENWFRWLGVLIRPTQTPYERADMMAAIVPEGKNSIRNLTRQFVLRRFSRDQNGDQEYDPRQEWKQLRPLLLRKTLTNWLQRRR